jgi:uncharacterized protein (TIGR02145 family)
MKLVLKISIMIIFGNLMLILIGCSGDKATNSLPDIQTPQISQIQPLTGSIGDMITIRGVHFGRYQNPNVVYFNDTKATEYISWNDTLIQVIVPAGAANGKIWVMKAKLKSNELDFTFISDIVKICNQSWMMKNLDVAHYRNGDQIPEVTDSTEWANLTTGAWCYYENNPENGEKFGKLYNWYAVNDPRGLAPDGWHIPSDDEWEELVMCLGDSSSAGGRLKDKGTFEDEKGIWKTPNTGAVNTSNFTALPAGRRLSDSTFENIRAGAYFWSTTDSSETNAWFRQLSFDNARFVRRESIKSYGYSVRCVRD